MQKKRSHKCRNSYYLPAKRCNSVASQRARSMAMNGMWSLRVWEWDKVGVLFTFDFKRWNQIFRHPLLAALSAVDGDGSWICWTMKNGRVSTLHIINLLPVVISKFNYLKFGFFYILGGPVPQFTFLSNLTQMTTMHRSSFTEILVFSFHHDWNSVWDFEFWK